MKFFSFILSFYVLALSCFPCGDGGECNVKHNQKISASTQHQHDADQPDACTPFCSCACCAASVLFQTNLFLKTEHLGFTQKKFHYHNDAFNSYEFHFVWQPPKIS